ncbi:MAG: hypothetical protein ACT4PL_08250, partial [Phycisphaerales bacterium]
MKREIQPVLASIFEMRDHTPAESAHPGAREHQERLGAMINLLQLFEQLGEKFVEWPTEHLVGTAEVLAGGSAGGTGGADGGRAGRA